MKIFLRRVFLVLVGWCCLAQVGAQTGKFYSTNNRLSSSLINQILQDKRGFIWIAAEYGLGRFDGLRFSNYKHVHRKLKELTNLSTREFIRNIRLQQAATLLKEKKLTVSEVAYATGYTNLSHFSTSFKEVYGVSPKEYMEEHLISP